MVVVHSLSVGFDDCTKQENVNASTHDNKRDVNESTREKKKRGGINTSARQPLEQKRKKKTNVRRVKSFKKRKKRHQQVTKFPTRQKNNYFHENSQVFDASTLPKTTLRVTETDKCQKCTLLKTVVLVFLSCACRAVDRGVVVLVVSRRACLGPPTAFPRTGPSVPWMSLPAPTMGCSDAQAGWHRRQSAKPFVVVGVLLSMSSCQCFVLMCN